MKIIVTQHEYQKAEAAFRDADGFQCVPAPNDEVGLAAVIRDTGARYVIVGTDPYRHELYEALPAGGAIARFGVGHDGIDKAKAAARDILCCNTPGVLDDSVADFAIGLMLCSARHLVACALRSQDGAWKPQNGHEVRGKTLAVIGCGKIGRRVARTARLGFGMHVIGCDIVDPEGEHDFAECTDRFDVAVKEADFVSLHIPDVAATRDFINAERLAQINCSAILLNTARGGVVDESALFDAVQSGALAGAALDVFKTEPYEPQDPSRDLRTLERILMTPHIGSSTAEASERMARAALQNIQHAVEGRHDAMTLVS